MFMRMLGLPGSTLHLLWERVKAEHAILRSIADFRRGELRSLDHLRGKSGLFGRLKVFAFTNGHVPLFLRGKSKHGDPCSESYVEFGFAVHVLH